MKRSDEAGESVCAPGAGTGEVSAALLPPPDDEERLVASPASSHESWQALALEGRPAYEEAVSGLGWRPSAPLHFDVTSQPRASGPKWFFMVSVAIGAASFLGTLRFLLSEGRDLTLALWVALGWSTLVLLLRWWHKRPRPAQRVLARWLPSRGELWVGRGSGASVDLPDGAWVLRRERVVTFLYARREVAAVEGTTLPGASLYVRTESGAVWPVVAGSVEAEQLYTIAGRLAREVGVPVKQVGAGFR